MSNRSGFTLVEVIVALTLLCTSLLAMTASSTMMSRAASIASRSSAALGLVQERLAIVRMDPAYAQLEARYEGTEATLDGFPGFTRETDVLAVNDSTDNGRVLDYKRVTVTVDGPGLMAPLSRTITVTRE